MSALAKLLLDPRTATEEDVKRRYRERARTEHPDVGGSPEEFAELVALRDAALEEVRTRPCAGCHGSGHVIVQAGFASVSTVCGRCRGTGK